ncbi:MAG: hypothetical protein KF698_07440 [Anaerolineales bacterium]|nr:hypothetical protein [Anaerolineales bacterium]
MTRYLQLILSLCAIMMLSSCSSGQLETPISTALPSATPTPPEATPKSPIVESTSPPVCEGETEGAEGAHLIGESYVDGTVVPPGENFSKIWTLSNVGETTWTDDYQVTFLAAPQGQTMGAPESQALGRCVLPGEEIEISIQMTAPENPGRYTVVFQLTNALDQVVLVNGGNFWVSIQSGVLFSGSSTAEGGFQSGNGVTVTLSSISSDNVQTRAELCFDFPSPDGWIPLDIVLTTGSQTFSSEGGSLGVYPFRCYYSIFQVSSGFLNQQTAYQIVVGKITPLELVEDHKLRCEQIKPDLKARYPGLDFACLENGSGQYVGSLSSPQGFTSEQAEVLVNDAIQGTIYGPWVISISP